MISCSSIASGGTRATAHERKSGRPCSTSPAIWTSIVSIGGILPLARLRLERSAPRGSVGDGRRSNALHNRMCGLATTDSYTGQDAHEKPASDVLTGTTDANERCIFKEPWDVVASGTFRGSPTSFPGRDGFYDSDFRVNVRHPHSWHRPLRWAFFPWPHLAPAHCGSGVNDRQSHAVHGPPGRSLVLMWTRLRWAQAHTTMMWWRIQILLRSAVTS